MLDEVFADAVVLQAVVQLLDDGLDDEDVGALVVAADIVDLDRKSTRLNSSHSGESRMPSSA